MAPTAEMKSSPSVNAREAHLSPEEVQKIDAWWRAVNYRSVGQIYLMNNPPLKEGLSVARYQTSPSRSQGHLNGYKIANPTVLARIPEEELINVRTYGEDMPEIRGWALAFIKPNLNKRCQ